MNAIIDFALHHSRTVLSALVLLVIAGIVSYIDLPKESDPNISLPVMYVQMSLEGISPEDSERLLLRPMEQELRSIEGIKEMKVDRLSGRRLGGAGVRRRLRCARRRSTTSATRSTSPRPNCPTTPTNRSVA